MPLFTLRSPRKLQRYMDVNKKSFLVWHLSVLFVKRARADARRIKKDFDKLKNGREVCMRKGRVFIEKIDRMEKGRMD